MAHFVTRSCFFRVEAARRSRGINSAAHAACMCWLWLWLWQKDQHPPTTHLTLGRRAQTTLHAVPDRAECICSLLARPIVILLQLLLC
jgi:hypothetical protein